ncbi:hypothetical protein SLEP1_g2953 [Rubroshorea leprosula]|uniref:Uncharacterized protein n=1 Tax=Rubroshorea leprosula TaxID=152421 RepID=A0AAV5HT56_9ROSI|nr:hypothetical protein SLEP1_g2953 [Rubroshorea leprosula]
MIYKIPRTIGKYSLQVNWVEEVESEKVIAQDSHVHSFNWPPNLCKGALHGFQVIPLLDEYSTNQAPPCFPASRLRYPSPSSSARSTSSSFVNDSPISKARARAPTLDSAIATLFVARDCANRD